jgi:hypothetical protein
MLITEKIVGIKDMDHAKYLEQKNLDIYEKIGEKEVINKPGGRLTTEKMRELERQIASDPDVKKAGYC